MDEVSDPMGHVANNLDLLELVIVVLVGTTKKPKTPRRFIPDRD